MTEYCKKHTEAVRFYACGGDGTLNEVVNGAILFPFASVTCYACGSGNDFVKVFANRDFKNLSSIINGEEKIVDLIKVNERYAINMCNFGFDAMVAYHMTRFKRFPGMNGTRSYHLALFYSLLFKMKSKCQIQLDGRDFFQGQILLTASSNGICCGGGYYCTPNAKVDDGLIDVVIVKKVGRIKFLKLVDKYKDGSYVYESKYQNIVITKKVKQVDIFSSKLIIYCVDGETSKTDHLHIEMKEKALSFVLPRIENS